jgi:hypothetical protein
MSGDLSLSLKTLLKGTIVLAIKALRRPKITAVKKSYQIKGLRPTPTPFLDYVNSTPPRSFVHYPPYTPSAPVSRGDNGFVEGLLIGEILGSSHDHGTIFYESTQSYIPGDSGVFSCDTSSSDSGSGSGSFDCSW